MKNSKFKDNLKKISLYLCDLLFPDHIKCVFCGDELDNSAYHNVCRTCNEKLPKIISPCLKCGSPLSLDSSGVCKTCKTNNYEFTQARSVFSYTDEIVDIIHKLKYKDKPRLSKTLALFLVDVYSTWGIFPDIVTFVPMTKEKEKIRGYNQSELLAKEFAKIVNLPIMPLCKKKRDTDSQTSLTHKERCANVIDCFSFDNHFKNKVKNKTILIIDDVITTGATTNEISKVLLKHGVKDCYVLSVAHSVLDNLN